MKNLFRTYVTFHKSTRVVGQASKAMEITYAKNTITNFKRLLGRQYHDIYVQQEKELNAYSILEGRNGSVNIEVKDKISFIKQTIFLLGKLS